MEKDDSSFKVLDNSSLKEEMNVLRNSSELSCDIQTGMIPSFQLHAYRNEVYFKKVR